MGKCMRPEFYFSILEIVVTVLFCRLVGYVVLIIRVQDAEDQLSAVSTLRKLYGTMFNVRSFVPHLPLLLFILRPDI
jgi:hypothetical protein